MKYEFYQDRVHTCPLYGFKAGHEILNLVLRCASGDSELTDVEYVSIITLAHVAHIKLMEDDYNEGWNQNA